MQLVAPRICFWASVCCSRASETRSKFGCAPTAATWVDLSLLSHHVFAVQVADRMIFSQERIRNAHSLMGKTALHRACEEVRLLLSIDKSAAVSKSPTKPTATGFAGPCSSSRTPDCCWCRHATALHSKFACTQTGWYFVFMACTPLVSCSYLAGRAHISCKMQAGLGRRSQASLCHEPVQCSVTTELKAARDLCKDDAVRYNLYMQALLVSTKVSHLDHC